jgi:hypothetical protein
MRRQQVYDPIGDLSRLFGQLVLLLRVFLTLPAYSSYTPSYPPDGISLGGSVHNLHAHYSIILNVQSGDTGAAALLVARQLWSGGTGRLGY